MRSHPKELAVPGDAFNAKESAEILRAWVVDGGLQVSLQRAFDGPEVWGLLLTDIARHAARIYAREGAMTEAVALQKIKNMFDAEWEAPTDTGTTRSGRN